MKIITARYNLVLTFLLTFIPLSLISHYFFLGELATVSMTNWIFDFLLLILICLPQAKLTLGEDQVKKIPPLKWISLLFTSQLLINLIFWGMAATLGKSLNANAVPLNFNIIHFSFSVVFFRLVL